MAKGADALTVDVSRLNREVCQEALNEAQSLIKTQIDASNNLASNLTTILSQSVTLAIAAFGAVALAQGSNPWMPGWGAIGFAAASIGWVFTAYWASGGLKPRKYKFGFSPRELFVEEVIYNPSAAAAFAYIASKLQEIIDFNTRQNAKLRSRLIIARRLFILAPVIGAIVSAIAAALFHLPPILKLGMNHPIR